MDQEKMDEFSYVGTFHYPKGLEKDNLFNFLDENYYIDPNSKKVELSEKDHIMKSLRLYREKEGRRKMSLINLPHRDQRICSILRTTQDMIRDKVLFKPRSINNIKAFPVPPHYDSTSVFEPNYNYLYFHKVELERYKFIRENAFRTYFQPLVLMHNKNRCSKHFLVNTTRYSAVFPNRDDFLCFPVDMCFDPDRYTWFKDKNSTVNHTYYCATTLLAYLLEEFYLRKVGASLSNLKGYIPYINSNYANYEEEYSVTKLENISILDIGLFNDITTALLYYFSTVDDRFLDELPLRIDPETRVMYIKYHKNKRLSPTNMPKAFYREIMKVVMNESDTVMHANTRLAIIDLLMDCGIDLDEYM